MEEKDLVAHRLVAIIPMLMRKIGADMRCVGGGLAPSHLGLLGMLSHQDHSVSELANLQTVTLATMSNTIASLAERGYLERVTPAHDRRVVQVSITPAGRQILADVHRLYEQRICELLDGLSPEELTQLDGGIRILRKLLETAVSKPVINCDDSGLPAFHADGPVVEEQE